MAAEGIISFDDSAWPFLVGTCPRELSDASAPAIGAFFDRVHARKQRFAVIIDTRPLAKMPSAKWRKDITAWATDPLVEADSQRYCLATGIIVSSALARGAFVALGWLRKPVNPVDALASMAEAAEWCGDLLTRAGVPLSANAQALRGPRPGRHGLTNWRFFR